MRWIVLTENQSSLSGNIPQDPPHCSCFERSRRRWKRTGLNLKSSKIESCRCITTSIGEKQETKDTCISNSFKIAAHAKRFPEGHWSFFGPGTEEQWYGTHTYKPNGLWNHAAETLTISPGESGHPMFRGTSALKAKEEEKLRFTATVIQRQQSCCFGMSLPESVFFLALLRLS